MTISARALGSLIGLTILTGCASSQDQMPLVFMRTQTFGANLSASVPDQGAHLTVGFNDRNVAVVPTTTRTGEPIRGEISEDGVKTLDSLSVLGQFEMSSKADAGAQVGLGTFFSTGQAASKLSDGFAAKMGYGRPPAPAPAAGGAN
jgi:hypothetical protein